MSFDGATRIKIISGVALVAASSVSILGGMAFNDYSRYSSNAFFNVMAILYVPGLTVAAVVGGALGIGGIHNPSLALEGILKFLALWMGIILHPEENLQTKNAGRLFGQRAS